jgi:TorA maturation chaperone TorD
MPHPTTVPPPRTIANVLRQWYGGTPIAMSVVVLLMIAADLARHGLQAPHHDEDAADHIAMLLMYGQIPIMGGLVATRGHALRAVLVVLAIQLALWAITFAAAVKLT